VSESESESESLCRFPICCRINGALVGFGGSIALPGVAKAVGSAPSHGRALAKVDNSANRTLEWWIISLARSFFNEARRKKPSPTLADDTMKERVLVGR
jgi:hypothetical protein